MNREDADASGAARQRAGQGTPRAKRKKARLPATPSAPAHHDPVSEPYLALAPPPVTALQPATTNSGLILPSDYVRSVNASQPRFATGLVSPPSVMPSGAGERRGSTPRPLPTPTPTPRGYVTNLLAPPFVVPGGRPSSPLPQPPNAQSRPPLPHTGSSSRSVNRSRDLPATAPGGRQSPMPTAAAAYPDPEQFDPPPPVTSRRPRNAGTRRVVNGTLSRRPTVSSREEHLSRRASMRRVNVWDDLPDAADPPPPFPFPVSSNSRLPPTFSPVDTSPTARQQVLPNTNPAPQDDHPRPYSPPPPFEQAVRLSNQRPPTPSSPGETCDDDDDDDSIFETDEQREDRRMWNADILAGYSLEERVAREAQRRAGRIPTTANGGRSESVLDVASQGGEILRAAPADVEAAIREVNGTRETSKDDLERAARQALETLGGRPVTKAEIVRVAREALAIKGGKISNLEQDAILPTAPATFIEADVGRRPVLERQEEPGVFYRVVVDGNKLKELGAKSIEEVAQRARPRTPSHSDSLNRPVVKPRSPEPTDVYRSGPRETLSTVDDIASIYNLNRPRQNSSTPALRTTPRPTSPPHRVRSPPPNASNLPRRQDSWTPPPYGSHGPHRPESPFRALTPQLQRNESFNRAAPGSPGLVMARSASPLNFRSATPQTLNRSQSLQGNAQPSTEEANEGELRTKKEILEALERERPKIQKEPPKPIMIANRENNDVAIISRSEEPGVFYRFMPAAHASDTSLGHPGSNPTSADSPGARFPRSPSPTRPTYRHTRSSSQSQVPTAQTTGQHRLLRSPKTMATDPTPTSHTHPPPPFERLTSASTSSLTRLRPPAAPAVDMINDGRASPAPAGPPPLPPRPPLEYITEYQSRTPAPPPVAAVPSVSDSSAARQRSASPQGQESSASIPSPVSEGAPLQSSTSPKPQSSKPPLAAHASPPNSAPLPTSATFSSPPTSRRPALPAIPSSPSVRPAPIPSVTASPKLHSGLQPEPGSRLVNTDLAALGFQQPSTGGGSMPAISSAEGVSSHVAQRPLPNTGFGSMPSAVSSEASGMSAYSSLTSAPGSGSHTAGSHPGPIKASSSPEIPTTESPSTSWLKRFGSADKLSIRSTSSTSTTASTNLPSHNTRMRQGSVSRSDDSGKPTPMQGDRSSARPRWMRRTSAEKHDKDSTQPSGRVSPQVSTHEVDKPLFSEPWRSPRKRTNTSPVVGSAPEFSPSIRYRHSHAEGVAYPTLTESPTPQEHGAYDRFDELEELHTEPAVLFLTASSPTGTKSTHQLPPGAEPSALPPRPSALQSKQLPPTPPSISTPPPSVPKSEPPRKLPTTQTRPLPEPRQLPQPPKSQSMEASGPARQTTPSPEARLGRAATPQPSLAPVPVANIQDHVAEPQTVRPITEETSEMDNAGASDDAKVIQPLTERKPSREIEPEQPKAVQKPVSDAKAPAEEKATNGPEAKAEERSDENDIEDKAEVKPVPAPKTTAQLLPPLFSQSYNPSTAHMEETPSTATMGETGPTTPTQELADEASHLPAIVRLDEHGNLIQPSREAALMRRPLYGPPNDFSESSPVDFSQPSTESIQLSRPKDLSDEPSATDSSNARTDFSKPTPRLNFTAEPRPKSVAAGKRPAPPPPPSPKHALASSPLLALSTNHLTVPSPPSPSLVSPDIVSLAASTSALLNLLEAEDSRPIAESSAQGATRAALSQQFRFELAQQREIEAQIHKSLQLAQSRIDRARWNKDLPSMPLPDDLSDDDELPGYEGGGYVQLPEKATEKGLSLNDDEELIDFGDEKKGKSSPPASAPVETAHGTFQPQQHAVAPLATPRLTRSQSQTQLRSSRNIVQPSSSGSSSTSDLTLTASQELRRRAPGPPPNRPPPPPPPPKSSPNRPPPPPPPARRTTHHRPAPPPPPHAPYRRPSEDDDPTEDINSPSTTGGSRAGFKIPARPTPESPRRELQPLATTAPPRAPPSPPPWKNPRFVSPLDPDPPEPSWMSTTNPPPPVPAVPKALAEPNRPPNDTTASGEIAREQPLQEQQAQKPQPKSAAPNLLSPDSPEVGMNGPLSAPAAMLRGQQRNPAPTNPSMWHMASAQRATSPGVTASSTPPRRPPPPAPSRNSAEFLSPASGPPMASVRRPNMSVGKPSYSSSTSSLIDFEGAAPTEAADDGSSSNPPRRGSRSPLPGFPKFPKPPMRWGSKNAATTTNGSRAANPGANSAATTAAATATTANNNSPGSTASPGSARHGSEHHATSSTSHETPSPRQPPPAVAAPAARPAPASDAPPRTMEITDLDVFVSRLEDQGLQYEGLSHLTEFLGPAKAGASQTALATLLPAEVEVESRRINAKGKVKLKLSVLGVRVANCPICLAQFRGSDAAVLLPRCGHVSHETCARRWFRESDCCMVCRTPLEEET